MNGHSIGSYVKATLGDDTPRRCLISRRAPRRPPRHQPSSPRAPDRVPTIMPSSHSSRTACFCSPRTARRKQSTATGSVAPSYHERLDADLTRGVVKSVAAEHVDRPAEHRLQQLGFGRPDRRRRSAGWPWCKTIQTEDRWTRRPAPDSRSSANARVAADAGAATCARFSPRTWREPTRQWITAAPDVCVP